MNDEQPAKLFIPRDNRPAPVRFAPVPMLADEVCQMSFGERSALEGLLSQARPRLAIEIGTYEGGSLSFLARHSEHVHTFDLYDLVADRASFGNVTFHTGDSRTLLPALLRSLESEDRPVDLALVDGDHSAEGVRADLQNLLDSSVTGATLILLHDTMNEETRQGIESVGLATHPKVVYQELDFVPGYEFAGGHFDGQVWGGVGLVITGETRQPGYRESTRQDRYADPFRRLHDSRRLRAELDAVKQELQQSQHWLEAIQSSSSWRLTEPLRRLKNRLRSRRS